MNKIRQTLSILVILTFFMCISNVGLYAQSSGTVSGTVTDAQSGETLPGVNISVKGTTAGTSTDADGNYSLTVESLQDTLVFSFVGYDTQQAPITGKSTINVSLEQQALQGQELVVVGYGTQQRSDLTGAISSISAKNLDQSKDVATSIDQLLTGKVAGLRVVQNSAEPGGGTTVNIRGSGSINAGAGPLYVIDGLPINNSPAVSGNGAGISSTRTPQNPLNTINPANIKSIEVLKDASATAIYGSRGANGVILITTKQGRGGRLHVNYNGAVGIQRPANRLDLLNAQQYHDVLNQIIGEGGGSPDEKVQEVTQSTNWQKTLERKDAIFTKHNMSFTGGNENTTYLVSLNYINQNGILINSATARYGARFNLESQISKRFNVGFHVNTSYVNSDIIAHGASGNQPPGVFYSAYNYDPTLSVRNPNGEYIESPHIFMDNPVAIANGITITNNSHRTYGTAFANYDILPALSVKTTIGTDVLNQGIRSYNSRLTKRGRTNNGIATNNEGAMSNYLLEGTMRYKQNFQNIHKIRALVGLTYQRFINENQRLEARNFPSDITQAYNLGLGDPNLSSVNSDYQSHRLLSYIGRVNYTFSNRYLVTGTLRIDGSSRFGSNNRFGYFPSGALGWRIKNEKFMDNINFISSLKIRGSWGRAGNQEIPNNESIPTFSSGATGILDGNPVPSIAPQRLANPDLQWETSTQWDLGIDFGLFKSRVTGNVDYYQKITSDMLVRVPVPFSTGFTSQLQNVGKMKNKGLELTLDTKNVDNKNFQWNSSINLSTLHNKVESLGSKQRILTGNVQFVHNIGLIEPGYTLRSFYGYKIEGVWQKDDDFTSVSDNVQPGDLKYKDVNGDGTINADDKVVLGNSFPEFTWSLGNTFSYKNIGLYVSFEGARGVSMFNYNLAGSYFPIGFRRNRYAKPLLDRWTPNHPSNKYPSFVNPNSEGSNYVNSYTVENAAYTRLKTLRLTYHFPTDMIENILSNASIFITGQNIVTFTKYSGLNPAANPNGGANFKLDINAYPYARTFLFGVNLKF